MSTPYTLKKLTEIEDRAAGFGLSEIQEARFANQDLDTEGTGVSLQRVKPDCRQGFAHHHEKSEEVYVVLSGSGRVKLDDDMVELEPLDALRVAPEVTRQFEAGSDGLEFIVLGPRHDRDGEMVRDWWTD